MDKEIKYKIGTKFVHKESGEKFVLATTSCTGVQLISIDNGNRWKSSYDIENAYKDGVTQTDFDLFIGRRDTFKVIKED